MPYPIRLPTTSIVAFQDFISSSTHPSIPIAATTSRGVVRNILKKHKRIPASSQAAHLTDVLAVLKDYVPYVFTIDYGLSGRNTAGEEIHITLAKDVEVAWRPVLTAGAPGRETPRIKLRSFEYELLFTLSTLASTHYLFARGSLHALYDTATPTVEQRAAAIATAMKHLLEANSIYNYCSTRASQLLNSPPAPDLSAATFGALAELVMAEATLIVVLKDDPYPAAVTQDRNKQDKEWMFKSPEITAVRALLFARLCLAAADHASKAQAMLGRLDRVTESLPKYLEDLRKTARGKACRFLGIDADISGRTGEAIAWLRGAKKELGFAPLGGDEEKKSTAFSTIKKNWAEKREDKKIEKGGEWGSDAGRFDEGRVVDTLFAKWEKMNAIMNVQLIPPSESLLSKLPSGREYHSPRTWSIPVLDSVVLSHMRAPPSPRYTRPDCEDDDSGDDNQTLAGPVGAFPGTASEHRCESTSSYY